ncbi:opioid growth factor receptor/sw-like protein [Plakobranchus ocellatus]|uniref:Opioid growth factor receptor/sw-like protein n=1 Tax=Plakobranchus ocellatus TaxID=259542 RepID=A0AAV4AW80_9GAST|nr:opioid growth factor receptor/sw-like protein [Plakobranchus ocellatus]
MIASHFQSRPLVAGLELAVEASPTDHLQGGFPINCATDARPCTQDIRQKNASLWYRGSKRTNTPQIFQKEGYSPNNCDTARPKQRTGKSEGVIASYYASTCPTHLISTVCSPLPIVFLLAKISHDHISLLYTAQLGLTLKDNTGCIAHGLTDSTAHGLKGCTAHGLMGCTAHGLKGCTAHGLTGCVAHGLRGCTAHGLTGCAAHGLTGCTAHGLPGSLVHGLHGSWFNGSLAHGLHSSRANGFTAHGLTGFTTNGFVAKRLMDLRATWLMGSRTPRLMGS